MIIASMAFIAPQNTTAQARVENDYNRTVLLYEYGTLWCTGKLVVTPTGNILIKMEGYIKTSHPLVPKKGVTKTIGTLYHGPNLIDLNILIYPDGKVKAVWHRNGSGDITPNS